MGRELQKSKNRSSIHKVKQKPKSKKRLLQHPVIAANWDKKQTLSQNYRRLGLTSKLNKSTGGVEKTAKDARRSELGEDGETRAQGDSLKIVGQKRLEVLDVGEVKIQRDPETGRILQVLDDGTIARPNPLADPLNDFDSEEEDDGNSQALHHAQHSLVNGTREAESEGMDTEVVRQLEERASRPEAKHKRRQTENEIAFIEELVRKYGDDYGKMARDMKINYMQRSEGDLKKRVKIWRENGGSVG